MTARYGCGESELAHYTCYRTSHKLAIDGRLDKPAWREAPKSHRFVDLVSGVPGFLETRMASLWDDDYLYVAFWVSEPNVRARLAERDALVWTENDVEIFIGGEDCYYEFEINALGTIYEVFYIWQDALKKGSRFDVPEFDLRRAPRRRHRRLPGRHALRQAPAGARWAFMDWDLPRPAGGGPGPGDAQRPLGHRRGLDGRDRLPLARHEAPGREPPLPAPRRRRLAHGLFALRAPRESAASRSSRTPAGPSTSTASTIRTSPSASRSCTSRDWTRQRSRVCGAARAASLDQNG